MLDGAFVLVFLLLALVAPFVLYVLVRGEHDRRETMDRREAERAARRDTSNASDARYARGARDERER